MHISDITTVEELESLPHGAVVYVSEGSAVLTMNRIADPYFECSDGGWIRCHHVFEHYGVSRVFHSAGAGE